MAWGEAPAWGGGFFVFDWIVFDWRATPTSKRVFKNLTHPSLPKKIIFLVFNVKQGWEPLCEFLKKPIPNEPFPNTNKKEDVDVESITKEVITLGSVAVFYGGIATLGFLAYKYDLGRSISRYF